MLAQLIRPKVPRCVLRAVTASYQSMGLRVKLVRCTSEKPAEVVGNVNGDVIVGVSKQDDEIIAALPHPELVRNDFHCNVGSVHTLYDGARRVLLTGLGEAGKPDSPADGGDTLDNARSALSAGVRRAQALRLSSVSVPLATWLKNDATLEQTIDALSSTAALNSYAFTRHRTNLQENEDREELLETVDFLLPPSVSEDEASSLQRVADAAVERANGICVARDIGNERADVANPEYFEQQVQQLCDAHEALSMTVIKGVKELEGKGLNMLSAVGQAARWEPRLVVVQYEPEGVSGDTVALVGKGITFDSGGLNLKPTGFIEDMHMDMCGAAAVLGALHTISKLNLKQKIVAAFALAENAIDANAYKPNCILKSHAGKTVAVGNTDAEGRLALADAMSFVQENHKPTHMIDLATLTGACVVALGEYAAGLFGNSPTFRREIEEAGAACNERCWPLPILKEHSAELKGEHSDLKSIGKDRYGGACTAAAFLKEFVRDGVEWVHLDIAGPAMYSERRGHMTSGSTGFGAGLLVEFVKRRAANPSG